MKREQLDIFLLQNGYNKIPSNLPEYTLYFRPENQSINVINVIDCSNYAYMTQDQYDFVKVKIGELFQGNQNRDLHILSLIIGDDWEKNYSLCEKDRFCWMISPTRNQLAIYEGQTPDFYGMRDLLERFLLACREGTFKGSEEVPAEARQIRGMKSLPWCVAVLVILNVLTFILCAITGDLLYNKGSLSIGEVLGQGQYYRMVSCMFLHMDLNHLFSNMLILYYIGGVVEKAVGHVRFLLLYFITGICASFMSMGFEVLSNSFYHSVGASGAVFGIMGALLLLVFVNKGLFREMTLGRVAFMVAFSLYSGFTDEHINNAAHMGGLVGGVIVMALLWLTMGKERKINEN